MGNAVVAHWPAFLLSYSPPDKQRFMLYPFPRGFTFHFQQTAGYQ